MTPLARTPSAHVSRSALAQNVAFAVASGTTSYPTSILRADAWGHGASMVLGVLEEAGLIRVDPDGGTRPRTEPAVPELLDPHALYGLPGAAADTTPAMRFSGTVLGTKILRAGEGVSYGYLYRAPADTHVALVTGGYAQGVVRSLGNATEVALSDRRCRIVGRVAMDACVVETADATVDRGDEAIYFGDPGKEEPALASWLAPTGMSAAEIVTAVGLHAYRVAVP